MTGGRGTGRYYLLLRIFLLLLTCTVHWMAPEIIQHSEYSERADVYSYGVCLWELVSRDLPFADIFQRQQEVAEAVLLRGRRPEIPSYCPPLISQLVCLFSADGINLS